MRKLIKYQTIIVNFKNIENYQTINSCVKL